MIDWSSFGEQMHIARRRAKLSQETLAAEVGTSRQSLNFLERGLSKAPRYSVIERICTVLGLELPRGRQEEAPRP